MKKKLYIAFATTMIFLGCILLLPAQAIRYTKADAEKALREKNYASAKKIIDALTAEAIAADKKDTLVSYVNFFGKLGEAQQNEKVVIKEFIHKTTGHFKDHEFSRKMQFAAASYFEGVGNYRQSYEAYKKAGTYIDSITGDKQLLKAQAEYNLGAMALKLGNVELASTHHKKAFGIRKSRKETPLEDIYLSANAMGSLMWYASKFDSASFYYNDALSILKKMPTEPLNSFYRPSIILNNLAGLYSADGKQTSAINAMKESIGNLQKFLSIKVDHPKKGAAVKELYEAIDNLAGIYKEVGDYKRAGDLLKYSYEQKKKKFPAAFPGIFISEIILGQHYNSILEFDKAISFLQPAIEKANKTEGDYLFWQADAYHALALAYEGKKDFKQALHNYETAKNFYDKAYGGEYDNIYLEFLRNLALFYAEHSDYKKGIALSNQAFNYIIKTQSPDAFMVSQHHFNLAEINLLANNYDPALQNAKKGLEIINKNLSAARNIFDTTRLEVTKPTGIYFYEKARHAIQQKKDSAFLQSVLNHLTEGFRVLDRRGNVLQDAGNTSIVLANNSRLIDFAKSINIELFELTGNTKYLDQLMNIQESGTYYKIRNRLEALDASVFKGVPADVIQKENTLKHALQSSLDKTDSAASVSSYFLAEERVNEFKNELRAKYPAYYHLRYEKIFRDFSNYQSVLPKTATLLRYFDCGSNLFAMVVTPFEKKFYRLDTTGVNRSVEILRDLTMADDAGFEALFTLYKKIWKPLEASIQTTEVTVIPDGLLSNISFDMLTKKHVQSTVEFLSEALISRHAFTYHYSLIAFQNFKPKQMKGNYIAFSPGFDDILKKDYLQNDNDSATLDREYLLLLPQPNTIDLIKEFSNRFKGEMVLGKSSTKSNFMSKANNYKIIHIGTHGEFNNLRPEQSRLIFAKSENRNTIDSNSLYLKDIYALNLNSNLAILAACESGKPGYQDGEGMVSFAHALNYAGSQNILTSIWKADEKSTCDILQLFLQNIKDKMPMAEALRDAKLTYLKTAEGRTMAPDYWSGIILMGSNTVLDIQKQEGNISPMMFLLAVAALVAVLVLTYKWYSKKRIA